MYLSKIDIEAMMLAPSQLEHCITKLQYEFFFAVLRSGDPQPVGIPESIVVHQLLLQTFVEVRESRPTSHNLNIGEQFLSVLRFALLERLVNQVLQALVIELRLRSV